MDRNLVLIGALIVALASVPAQAQQQNRAGLVVQYGDGSTTTRCVTFSEASITGYELLRRSGLPIVVEAGSMGAGVCKIGNEGCNTPAEPCFCKCQTLGASCMYWVYSQFTDGAWRISGLGASARQVRDGDVDAWTWGTGDGNTGQVPVLITLDQICAPSAAPAAVAPTLASTAPATLAAPAPTAAASAATTEATPTYIAAEATIAPTPAPVTATPIATIAPASASSEPTVGAPMPTSAAPVATPATTAATSEATIDAPTPMPTPPPAAADALGALPYIAFLGIAGGLAVLVLVARRRGPP